MTYAASAPVTVGVDGSLASLDAVAWVTDEARRHGRAVNLVYVSNWPTYAHAMWPAWGPPAERDGRAAGHEILGQAAKRAAAVDPGTWRRPRSSTAARPCGRGTGRRTIRRSSSRSRPRPRTGKKSSGG